MPSAAPSCITKMTNGAFSVANQPHYNSSDFRFWI
jgi:hypothetical protein